MLENPFSEIRFSGTLRPSQTAASQVIGEQLSENQKQLYIVAPPGSGKTILGLHVWADILKVPALVLSPNSAIQAQWIARTSLFELSEHEHRLALEPSEDALLTSLTYQSLTMVKTKSADLESQGFDLWIQKLIDDGEALDDFSARSWLNDLQGKNPEYFEKQMKKYRKKARQNASEVDGKIAWLSESSKKSIETLKKAKIQLIILDECHHLTEHWGEVLVELKKELGDPFILGLTATPPNPDIAETPHYLELLGEIDYEVPIPALVRDSNLAPYQDLSYFVRPNPKELEYIANADNAFMEIVDEISTIKEGKNRALPLPEWLYKTLEGCEIPGRPNLNWNEFSKALPEFSSSAIAYLIHIGEKLPAQVPRYYATSHEKSEICPIFVLRPVLERYVRFGLRRSSSKLDHELAQKVTDRFRLLGYQITESGSRPCASPVGRILAYAEAKTEAISEILRVEIDALDEKIRCVIVSDFEKTSSTALVEEIHSNEVGGAIGIFKSLVECELGDSLDPVLMTGSTLLVDDDLAQRFMEKAESWVNENNVNISFRDEKFGRYHQIHGSGKDWAPRYYSTMVTEFFQEGFTKCLIGTRGLLGEGWDASRINVLIDMTTVTTSMSINQLRGRSMRLDNQWPEKVANNWDIICLAEEFIKGFDDYERFEKKHKNLYGVCDDGSIEKGVGHVHAAFTELEPEGINEGMAVINQEMLQRAGRRAETREFWGIGRPFNATPRKSLEFENQTKGVGGGFKFGSNEIWSDDSLNIAIIQAVAQAMQDGGLISKMSEINGGSRGGGWYRFYLENCTEEESELFAQAISDVFGDLDGARYVIPRSARFFDETFLSKLLPEVLAKYLRRERQDLVMFHKVPSCLANRKVEAEWLEHRWNELVSPGEVFYAHSKSGKELIKMAKENQLVYKGNQHLKDVFI